MRPIGYNLQIILSELSLPSKYKCLFYQTHKYVQESKKDSISTYESLKYSRSSSMYSYLLIDEHHVKMD